jgi:drug/metabolite transporter (DMT)-like permease
MFLGRLFALLAALASSGTPVFAQTLRDAGWSPWQVNAARSALGFVLIALWLRSDLWLARKNPVGIAAMMLVYLVGSSSYLYAVMHASMGTAVSVLYLSTGWVTLIQRLRGDPERYDVPASVMLVVGVACVVGFGGPEDTWQGIAAAFVGSGMQCAFTLLGIKLTKTIPATVVAAWGLLGGTVAFGWLMVAAPWSAPGALVAVIGIGTVSGLAYLTLSTLAFSRIGHEARMWFPFDLVFIWIAQILWQGCLPSPASIAGVLLILFAALLLAWGKRHPPVP